MSDMETASPDDANPPNRTQWSRYVGDQWYRARPTVDFYDYDHFQRAGRRWANRHGYYFESSLSDNGDVVFRIQAPTIPARPWATGDTTEPADDFAAQVVSPPTPAGPSEPRGPIIPRTSGPYLKALSWAFFQHLRDVGIHDDLRIGQCHADIDAALHHVVVEVADAMVNRPHEMADPNVFEAYVSRYAHARGKVADIAQGPSGPIVQLLDPEEN